MSAPNRQSLIVTMTSTDKTTGDGKPLPAYVISGSDSFLQLQSLNEVIKRVLGTERDNMGFVEFDGSSAELADVLDECRTPSLLASVRLVCVRDADQFITNHRKSLERYLLSPSPTGVLVLVCTKWNPRWNIYKIVSQIGRNIACNPPKGRRDVVAWTMAHASRAYRCKLDSSSAYRLVELVGDELGLLDMELAKLATFVAPRTSIRLADVENLVGASRGETVFRITDAIARRDPRQALILWDQVLAGDRDAPYRAVGGLAYSFRKLVEAKRLVAQGLSMGQVAKTISPWAKPADVKRQLDRFSLRQWQDHLVQLLRIDLGAKSGLGTVRSSVEKLIVKLCSAS